MRLKGEGEEEGGERVSCVREVEVELLFPQGMSLGQRTARENIALTSTVWDSSVHQQTWESTHPISSLSHLLSPLLSPDYSTFTSKRFTLTFPPPATSQAALAALNAPITKVWTWWFPLSSFTPRLEEQVPKDFETFVAANVRDQAGMLAHAGGWREEEDVIGERQARSFTGFVGCRSVEDFYAGPPPFEGNIGGRIGLGMRTFAFGGGE